MTMSLKDQNTSRLVAACVFNVAIFFALIMGLGFTPESWMIWLPAPLSIALIAILNGLVNAQTKARIVFWRWHHPLPGSRAFSEIAKSDPRIDIAAIRKKIGKLPRSPQKQNAAWYSLYQSVKGDPSVASNHRDYLFARDYASLAALMLVPLVCLGFWLSENLATAFGYAAVLVLQYLIVRLVAANFGYRFAATALAVSSVDA